MPNYVSCAPFFKWHRIMPALTPPLLFKALADETRARATLLIAQEGELCVCELTEALGQSQPKISRHLGQLREAGVLQDQRRGQWVYYRIQPALPTWAGELLHTVAQANRDWLAADTARLRAMANRPNACA